MRIETIRIQNYKCFADSGDVELSPFFNVFVGQNDSGKSALLEALKQANPDRPHLSNPAIPNRETSPLPVSTVSLTYRISAAEIQSICRLHSTIIVPTIDGGDTPTLQKFQDVISKDVRLLCSYRTGKFPLGRIEQHGDSLQGSYSVAANTAAPRGIELKLQGQQSGEVSDIGTALAATLQGLIYVFKAERLNVGEHTLQGNSVLTPNAANLADVINQLSTRNRPQFDRLMGHIRTVFPHITDISAPLIAAKNMAQILVWTTAVELEREDLAIPLAESGTGISQVLALLYVVVTATSPRIIAIDEPQSFLHPGAVRKLFEILRDYKQHQYIITTHSPLALAMQDTDAMFIVRRGDEGSRVIALDIARQEDLRLFLSEVGARLGDVFGADSIFWVEGATEEACFPMIIREVAELHLRGIQLLGVLSTDELAAKHASRIWEIYERLSTANSLMPPALAFLFDRDGRSDEQRLDIERRSRCLVKWLPRRMYENYLLDPAAIATVVSSEDKAEGNPIGAEDVAEWVQTHANSSKYIDSTLGEYPGEGWLVNVHGARLLEDLFAALTSARVPYSKVVHGKALTRRVIAQRTADIVALGQFLGSLTSEDARFRLR